MRITLPPPRILSIDIQRFETINEDSGFLNAIAPEDRNRWYSEARSALEHGALAQGALDRAQIHAEELFEAFVARHGYTLVIGSGPARRAAAGSVARRRSGDARRRRSAAEGVPRDDARRRPRRSRLIGARGAGDKREGQGQGQGARRPRRRRAS